MKYLKKPLFFIFFFSVSIGISQDTLLQEFQNPPHDAKPQVWYRWLNGNVSKDGIKKDLDWLQSIGIGGIQHFDADIHIPTLVPEAVTYMSPEWKDAFRFTTEYAKEKVMDVSIASSPGWSLTGGPWVAPENSMKKYTWTETRIKGGSTFKGKLKKPSDNAGEIQNIIVKEGGVMPGYGFIGERPNFYKDVAVLAFKLTENDIPIKTLNPKITSSGGSFNLKDLTDGNLMNSQFLPPNKIGEEIWIQYEFPQPQTIKAFTVSGANHTTLEGLQGGPKNRSFQVSDDGITFREVATISGSIVPHNTVSIPPTTAKYFRLVYKTMAEETLFGPPKPGGPKALGVDVSEFVLHTSDRIDQFEDKAGFTPWVEKTPTYLPQNEDAIAHENIIDLTDLMEKDGSISWKVPKGNWKILRFGYSLTGRQNHPATKEGTGLEIDKLDKGALNRYLDTYLKLYAETLGGPVTEKGLKALVMDSYESGNNTWTALFSQEFEKKRGYSLLKWLPVLTGNIVESTEKSEAFLWDFRKTIGELTVENHYDILHQKLRERDLKSYTQSQENNRIYLADGMDVKRYSDIPMGSMWTMEEPRNEADIRESASVAHIYGQKLVSAESMTSLGNSFSESPEVLKRTVDLEMASGLNQFALHVTVHQPLDDKKPGLTNMPFGQTFSRHEAWASQAKPWIDYLARSSSLLQQGKNVADILYYYGENTNITLNCKEGLPELPAGLEFDFVNSSALLNAIEANNGKLVAKSGNTYAVLVLDETAKLMTLPVLKKIKTLAHAGIKIIGERPIKSPSLSDDATAFQKLADEIWNSNAITSFEDLEITPDVLVTKTDNEILYRHRQTSDTDIYWLNNRSENSTTAEISFRVTDKIPELWNPVTGKTEKVSYTINDGRTIVPLNFNAWDAFFIVFKEKTKSVSYTKPTFAVIAELVLKNPWQVSFQKERGAPENASFEQLHSLSEDEHPGIKYFSGTATYQSTFNIKKLVKGARYELDLGTVKNIAEVSINGKQVGTLWKSPFVFDITDILQKKENNIEIKVTNTWVNRLIGDAQPNVKNKTTFTLVPAYRPNSALLPAGLLGPVKIRTKK